MLKRKEHLDQHMRGHSDERPFKCPVCQQEVSFVLKDGFMKQEPNFLQYIQHLQKDQNLIHTFSSFKEQAMKETNILQQQAVNMNEILPQNTRYLMPS